MTDKRLYQAFCWHCNSSVGRVRKYHDSAVEEAAKHEVKNMDCRTTIISMESRIGLKMEMGFLVDRENLANQCGRRHVSTIEAVRQENDAKFRMREAGLALNLPMILSGR